MTPDPNDQPTITPETLVPSDGESAIDRSRAALDLVPGYEILGEVGRGGMGVVYKARQLGLNRLVALKMILAGSHASPDERGRLRREAEAIARLQHPNIVDIFEVSEHGGQPFFSLEFCGGGSLADKLTGTPLPPREAARLLMAIARGIQHAHEHGIVHRDLKPGNVLFVQAAGKVEERPQSASGYSASYDFNNAIPKITDFGLAKTLDADSRTRDGDVMGTPSYMSPEQAAGKVNQVGPHSDTYALGAMLYELLTGRPPFVASSPMETVFQVITRDPVPVRALQPKTPRDLETIALKCLQKEPSRRYGSAADLADDLQRYLGGRPIRARPVGPAERAWRWMRRHPSRAALVAVVAATLLVGISGWVWFTQRLSAEKELAREKAAEAEQARGLAVLKQREAEQNLDLAVKNATLAERSFLKALEVAEQFFTEVSESTLLHEPGMEPLRQQLLRKARDYYAGFRHERRDDPRLAGELARSTYRLGVIDAELNDLNGGVAYLYEALGRFDQLLKLPTADGRLPETRARLLNDLGKFERKRHRPDEANAAYRKAREAWEQFDRETSSSRTAKEGLGRCLLGLGNVAFSAHRFPEALSHFQQSLALRLQLEAEDVANETYQRDVAVTHQNLAVLHQKMGETAKANEERRLSLETFRRLVESHPNTARYREDFAAELYNAGFQLMHGQRFLDAAVNFVESARQFDYLAARHPAIWQYQSRLGDALYNRAVSLDKANQPKDAEEGYNQAREVRKRLAVAQPDVAEFQWSYAQSLRRDADRAIGRKEMPRGIESLRQARTVLEKAPPSAECRLLLAIILFKLGKVEANKAEAVALLDRALAEVQGLLAKKVLVDRAKEVEQDIKAARAKR